MGFRLSLLRQATEFSLTSKVFASSAAGKLSGGSAGALHLLRSGNSCDQGTPAGGEPNRSGRQVAAVGGAGATLPWMMSRKPSIHLCATLGREINGLKKVDQPGRSRFEPSLFAPR